MEAAVTVARSVMSSLRDAVSNKYGDSRAAFFPGVEAQQLIGVDAGYTTHSFPFALWQGSCLSNANANSKLGHNLAYKSQTARAGGIRYKHATEIKIELFHFLVNQPRVF